MGYTAKITDAREEFFLAQNASFMDIWFDILKDGVVVAKRRLAYPLGTAKEVIEKDVQNYPKMFEQDILTSEKAAKEAEAKLASVKILEELKGKTY
jgi:hypothetical protein